MNFPLELSFKKIALAPQLSVTDANGRMMMYVKQKLFKLKEAVTVFADREQNQPLFTMQADRVIDFSAQYNIHSTDGTPIGGVKRAGMRSLWKSHYDITRDGRPVMTIREANPWVKVIDGLIGEIPVIGMFTGYFFHPAYVVERSNGEEVLRLEKQPALFESKYTIRELAKLDPSDESLAILSLLMMVLLERTRG